MAGRVTLLCPEHDVKVLMGDIMFAAILLVVLVVIVALGAAMLLGVMLKIACD